MFLLRELNPDDKIVYIHVPKTAGASVRVYFETLLGPENVGWLGRDFSYEGLAKGKNFEGFKVIGGHFTRSMAESIPFPKVYVSTVREPVNR